MTLNPETQGSVKDRPDLPAYELAPRCQVPGCTNFREEGGGHHVWRRSSQMHSHWVELENGDLVPNRVGLCWMHHRDVTGGIGGHKAKIQLGDDGEFYWMVKNGDLWDYYGQLESGREAVAVLFEDGERRSGLACHSEDFGSSSRLAIGAKPSSESTVVEGEKCPTCKRRVNHKKKPSSPTTKVFSVRVPIDDLEAWEEALDAASEHLGIGTKTAHHRFKTLNAGLALCLQAPKGLLE